MSLMIPLCNKLHTFALLLLCSVMSNVSYAEEDDVDEKTVSAYVDLKPNFVLNHVGNESQLKYIKTSISIRTDESKTTLIKDNMPLVRDAIVMFLSARTTEQVTGAVAREKTRADAAIAVNTVLEKETGTTPVKDILFTSFVTQ